MAAKSSLNLNQGARSTPYIFTLCVQNTLTTYTPLADIYGLHGKVDLKGDMELLNFLTDLPQDVPLLDVFSKETYIDAILSSETRGRAVATIGEKALLQARSIFEPLCDENTTVSDIVCSYRGYFEKMARHALARPEDFRVFDSCMGGTVDEITEKFKCRSSVREVIDILERKFSDMPGKDELIKGLERSAGNYEQKVRPKLLNEYLEKRRNVELEYDRHTQQLNESPEHRGRCSVMLYRASRNTYIWQAVGAETQIPTRMDWLHWLQKIDPQNAKAADIVLDDTGCVVTIHNEAGIAYLHKKLDGAKTGRVVLPNRRMGSDLQQKLKYRLP